MFRSKYYLPQDSCAAAYSADSIIKSIKYSSDREEYKNAIILPLRKFPESAPGMATWAGGVCSADYKFLDGYYRKNNKSHPPENLEIIRSYEPEHIKEINETVIYAGFLSGHFGNFLIDSLTRLWYPLKYSTKKYKIAFLPQGNPQLDSFQFRFFDLLGIKDRVELIHEPTLFKSVIVPKQAWFVSDPSYNSDLNNIVFEFAGKSVKPQKYKKIYLSRGKFIAQDMFGENYFEHFFESKGFKIIYPEQLPIEEQISHIVGAEVIACTYGTLAHLAFFARENTQLICLLRYPLHKFSLQNMFNKSKNIDYVYIDVSLSLLPNYHSSNAGYLIGPTTYWNEFLLKEYGFKTNTDVFEYLDNTNIKLGSLIKLYTEKNITKANLSMLYGYRFDYVNYLKNLYNSFAPRSYNKVLEAMKLNSHRFFSGRLFIYKRPDINLTCTVKLLPDGRIWPVNLSINSLKEEKFWSFLRNRLYFLNGECKPVIEYVAETQERKHDDNAKYEGVVLSKVTESCSLKTFQPGAIRNWIIKHIIKYTVNKRKYKKLKQKPDRFFKDSKSTFIRLLSKYYIRGNSTVIFYWRKQFQEYFHSHDMNNITAAFKESMDDISCRYIDNFMKLSRYWNKSTCVGNQWTDHDLKKQKKYKLFAKTFVQPFPEILRINPYYFFDSYGLLDLPPEVLSSIDGNIIIDGRGLNGDTALAFHRHFPNSEIHVYEPIEHYVGIINSFLAEDDCGKRIKPINKGLGNQCGKQFMRFGVGANMANITTIDNEYKDAGKPIGLIKLDTEGMETGIIQGAEKTITRDKPVLAIAIYHRPEDFFELKGKIKNLNHSYRFMVRRSEPSHPQADLVLIAY